MFRLRGGPTGVSEKSIWLRHLDHSTVALNEKNQLTRIWFACVSVSQNSASQSSSSEIDEGPAAKLARFTSELIAETNQRKTITNQTKKKQYEKPNANQSDDEVSISPRWRVANEVRRSNFN